MINKVREWVQLRVDESTFGALNLRERKQERKKERNKETSQMVLSF